MSLEKSSSFPEKLAPGEEKRRPNIGFRQPRQSKAISNQVKASPGACESASPRVCESLRCGIRKTPRATLDYSRSRPRALQILSTSVGRAIFLFKYPESKHFYGDERGQEYAPGTQARFTVNCAAAGTMGTRGEILPGAGCGSVDETDEHLSIVYTAAVPGGGAGNTNDLL